MQKHAIFLSGPIGTGKTTLGKALAEAIGGGFIDGDDHSDPERPWYHSILRTSEAVVRAGLTISEKQPFVVIAYPLGCATWIYYKRKFDEAGMKPIFVSLRASYERITSSERGRKFSDEEKARIKVMIHEGYAERPFSDLIIDTDERPFHETVERLEFEVMRIIHSARSAVPP